MLVVVRVSVILPTRSCETCDTIRNARFDSRFDSNVNGQFAGP